MRDEGSLMQHALIVSLDEEAALKSPRKCLSHIIIIIIFHGLHGQRSQEDAT